MVLHFPESELADRRKRACESMAADGLHGMLLFRQESLFYLTGFDTFGYVFFQCLYLGADGTMTLLTRAPDRDQARLTSVIEDVRIWVDGVDANPAGDLRVILEDHGCAGRRLGVEFEAYGLTGRSTRALLAALDGFCELLDASELVSTLRLVKSPAELTYVRRAADLADDALDEALRLARPGADEAEILAAMQGAVFSGGGDYPGNEFIIGSGDHGLMCRYHSGRRRLSSRDQLTLEFAGTYRHYHACLMRVICIGEATERHRELHSVAVEAMTACAEAMRPGRTIGDVYEAHARTFDDAGLARFRLNACGYSLGALFAPSWMDWPMIYAGNPVEIEPNMVFFTHLILQDRESGVMAAPGQTLITTDGEAEILTRHPQELCVR